MLKVYRGWGFLDSPFHTLPLGSNPSGKVQLVGRDRELKHIAMLLDYPPKWVTVEGENGVGKTSLINVAIHLAYQRYLSEEGALLLLPCRDQFQIYDHSTVESFEFDVLKTVAQTLLRRGSHLEDAALQHPQLNNWLNSATFASWSAGSPWLSAGRGATVNNAQGFMQSGFRQQVIDWLQRLFPTPGSGVVCVLDNIELLQNPAHARGILEQLRDTTFALPGLRWVLCGANGIVHSTLTSPRLSGHMHSPVELHSIDDGLISQLLLARKRSLAGDTVAPYLPLTDSDFQALYARLGRNLRAALQFADEFCVEVALGNTQPQTDTEKSLLFTGWLTQKIDKVNRNLELDSHASRLLGALADEGGCSSLSPPHRHGFSSVERLNASVQQLRERSLIVPVLDGSGRFLLSHLGWLLASPPPEGGRP